MENISKEVSDLNLCIVIFEVKLVDSNQENGGLILVLHVIFAVTRTPLLSWFLVRKGRSCMWAMLQLPRSRERHCDFEDDF